MFVPHFFPVESFEPFVLFDFFYSVDTESFVGFALYESVDEVDRAGGPSSGNVFLFDDRLFGEDLVSDFSSGSAVVGSSAHHAFVANDACCYCGGLYHYGIRKGLF